MKLLPRLLAAILIPAFMLFTFAVLSAPTLAFAQKTSFNPDSAESLPLEGDAGPNIQPDKKGGISWWWYVLGAVVLGAAAGGGGGGGGGGSTDGGTGSTTITW